MSEIIVDSSSMKSPSVLDDAEMIQALSELLTLEYNLIPAYEAVLKRIENESFSDTLLSGVSMHHAHIELLKAHIETLGGEPGTEGDLKQMLTQGYVVLASLLGDYRLISAMKQNLELAEYFYVNANKQIFTGAIQLTLKQLLGQTRKQVVQFETWLETMTETDVESEAQQNTDR